MKIVNTSEIFLLACWDSRSAGLIITSDARNQGEIITPGTVNSEAPSRTRPDRRGSLNHHILVRVPRSRT